MRADSQSEQRLSVVLGHERDHAVGRGMMGKNLTFDMEWVRSCPECGEPAIAVPPPKGAVWQCTSCDWQEPDEEWKQLEADARLGAAVRKALWPTEAVGTLRFAVDEISARADMDGLIPILEAIADALEAEAEAG